MKLSHKQTAALVGAALAARKRAYAPYSKFLVGAAVLTKDGKLFSGCNVENASYGLTVCAERVAIAKAVSEGARKFVAIAVAAENRDRLTPPCGACRQVMSEFAPDLSIILVDARNAKKVEEVSLADLLPRQFRFAKIRQRRA